MNEQDSSNEEGKKEMSEDVFRSIVEEEWKAVPAEWQRRIQNVALLVEDEPNEEVRASEGLGDGDMLLGIYQGIPLTERGEAYGTGMTMPDTVTIYRLSTLAEAHSLMEEDSSGNGSFEEYVRVVVRETVWHELGHYFGHNDAVLHIREDEGSNAF